MKTRIYPMISLALALTLLAPVKAFGEESDLAMPMAVPGKIEVHQVVPASVQNVAPAAVSLKQAIVIVKQNFSVPAKLTEFDSGYEAYNQTQVWRLQWSSQDNTQGNFTATVDATTGEIVSMNRWDNQPGPASRVPTVTLAQARQIGQKLINRLLPDKAASLQANEDYMMVPINNYGQQRYTMKWDRFHQGIPVDGNQATIDIDMQTGEPVSYNLNWHNIKLPESAGIINIDQAARVFSNEAMLTLQYFVPQRVRPLMDSSAADSRQPRLVYALHHPSGGAIDAITGKPFIQPLPYGSTLELAKNQKSALGSSADVAVLTPAEQTEIDSSQKLLNQEQAVQAALKWIKLPEGYTLQSSNLGKQNMDDDTSYWNLNWQKQTQSKSSNGYIWAQVDAQNGELISFNLNNEEPSDVNKTISQDEARKLAEDFIKRLQAQRWPELRLDENSNDAWNGPSNWSFTYYRMVNAIPYFDNSVNVTVNANSEIISYNLAWSKAKFPPAQGLITRDKANSIFLEAAPLKLRYTYTNDGSDKSTAHLVYLPEVKDGFYMLDAKSGAKLNWEGNNPASQPRALYFNDIKGHYAEQEISLLGQAGIMGEYGDSFHPEEKITLRSLLTAMLKARAGVYGSPLKDEELINRCKQEGWISDTPKLDDQVTRELLAGLMLRYLKIEYLLDVKDIYQVPYHDAKTMSPQTYATAAINWGLGIIRADGKNFDAGHQVTRGEAAAALVHMLSIKVRQ